MNPTATTTRPQALTVASAELKAVAQWTARTLPTRPAVPVMADMVLQSGDGLLSMSAFDFETYATAGIPALGGFDGPVVVHGRTFAEAVARLAGPVTLIVEERILTLSAGRQTFRLRRIDESLYPQTPKPAPTVGRIEFEDLEREMSLPTLFDQDGAA